MEAINQKSIFSFCFCREGALGNKVIGAFERSKNVGGYTLYTDSYTPLDYAEKDGRELVVFGYAVDVFSAQSKQLAKTVLDETTDFDSVIEYEKKLGGKYVIFYAEGETVYCMGDATCSVPVFYTRGLQSCVCCDNANVIIKEYGLKPDDYFRKIRNSGNINQAMPYDNTVYREIKQLIPNHYIDLSEEKTVRFINSAKRQKKISPEKSAEITAPMIEKLTAYYLSEFKIYCPLTSGRDSRVVYAFLKSLTDDVKTYTVWHDRFEKDDQDWTVPLKLTSLYSTEHKRIYKETVTDELKNKMDAVLGENAYPQDAFTLSVTVVNNFPGYATVEGDIIGQVGKCSLHRNIPEFLATPAYFRCKLHNYSKEAKCELKKWLKEIKKSGEKVNSFDLFSVENRLGVWASHTHQLRNVMGQPFINIFNSRSIIYTWTAVDRAKRMKSLIHINLIKLRAPEMLGIPFEEEKKGIVVLAKSSAPAFYFGSFTKYYVQKKEFFKNNRQ